MDEPSFGLSPILVMEIERIIQEIEQREGMTIMVAEQNSRLAFELSEYCYVMEHGRIALEGETVKLLQDERVKDALKLPEDEHPLYILPVGKPAK